MRYALIQDGVVVNIIALHGKNANDFPNAVPIEDIPVVIGDIYENENFYRDGEILMAPDQKLCLCEAAYIKGVQEA